MTLTIINIKAGICMSLFTYENQTPLNPHDENQGFKPYVSGYLKNFLVQYRVGNLKLDDTILTYGVIE
jgi:hypothetical protein